MSRRWFTATLLGLLAAALFITAQPYIKARNTPSLAPCVPNLAQIDGAKQQWALEYEKLPDDIPRWDDIQKFLRAGTKLTCPEGGTYVLGRVRQHPTCSLGGSRHSLD